MNRPSFSKIWIVVILIILIVGRIFAWHYFGVSEEEVRVPGKEVVEKDETANWKIYLRFLTKCFLLLGFWSKKKMLTSDSKFIKLKI
jgi:phosphatidylglycerophosphate synthase